MKVINIIFMSYLFLLSYLDIRHRELSGWMLVIGFIFVPMFLVLDSALSVVQCAIGMVPGLAFLFVSYITRGQVGIADAVLVICIGMTKGISGAVVVLGASLIFTAMFSGVMMIAGKVSRKTTIPFVPFLFLGDVFFHMVMGISG